MNFFNGIHLLNFRVNWSIMHACAVAHCIRSSPGGGVYFASTLISYIHVIYGD